MLLATTAVALAQDLPPGPGAEIVSNVCQGCHGLDEVTAARHDTEGWKTVVDDMIGRGASIPDDQAAQIVAYLGVNFGMTPAPAEPAPAAPADAAPPPAQ